MKWETVEILHRINKTFYQERVLEFDATRGSPWQGWFRLLPYLHKALPQDRAAKVLDVGCGNGRFGHFLREYFHRPFRYVGIDSSRRMLETARANLAAMEPVTLLEGDVVERSLDDLLPVSYAFDLVVVFGLFHHIPSHQRRRAFLEEIVRVLEPAGLLVAAFWQFARFERFRKKAIDWKAFCESTGTALDLSDLEDGDHLLSWGDPAGYRYCHFVDPNEAERLLSPMPLEIMDSFRADGENSELNLYYVLRRLRLR